MKENKVRAVLSDENHALKEWQETHTGDLPGIIETIKQIKEYVNDYLTHLVTKEKVNHLKDQVENLDDNEEEEEVGEDRISGLIRDMVTESEKNNRNVKRKTNYSNQVKKFKK